MKILVVLLTLSFSYSIWTGEYFLLNSKTHSRILQFLSDASQDPSRQGMGSYVNPETFRENYLENFPNIPIELMPYEDKVIAALDALGFFQYRRGGDGGFDYREFSGQIYKYAKLFAKNPHLLDKVKPYFFSHISDYRKYGQVVPLHLFLVDIDSLHIEDSLHIIERPVSAVLIFALGAYLFLYTGGL